MKRKYLLLAINFLLVVLLLGCVYQVFDGNRTSNNNQFIMSFKVLNGTKVHEMNLEEGDIIDVDIERLSGKLVIIIADNDGNEIYKNSDVDTENFKIPVPETKTYRFTVTGSKAKGSVSFKITE